MHVFSVLLYVSVFYVLTPNILLKKNNILVYFFSCSLVLYTYFVFWAGQRPALCAVCTNNRKILHFKNDWVKRNSGEQKKQHNIHEMNVDWEWSAFCEEPEKKQKRNPKNIFFSFVNWSKQKELLYTFGFMCIGICCILK